jgi:hypothetical protein
MKKLIALITLLTCSASTFAEAYQCLLGGYERQDGSTYRATSKLWADVKVENGTLLMIDEDTKTRYESKYIKEDSDKEGKTFVFCQTNTCQKYGILMNLYFDKNRPPSLVLNILDGNKLSLRRYYTCLKK